MKISCIGCGKVVETKGSGDFSTYLCEVCQEKVNIPAYEAEIKELKELGKEATQSQKVRLAFVKDLLEAAKKL